MELRELTSKVIELLNIESPDQIPDSLMEIVLNGKTEYQGIQYFAFALIYRFNIFTDKRNADYCTKGKNKS